MGRSKAKEDEVMERQALLTEIKRGKSWQEVLTYILMLYCLRPQSCHDVKTSWVGLVEGGTSGAWTYLQGE